MNSFTYSCLSNSFADFVSIGGSDSGSSKGPLERLGFKLMLGEKKTRGKSHRKHTVVLRLMLCRWTTTKEKRSETGQQARAHTQAGTQQTGAEVSILRH